MSPVAARILRRLSGPLIFAGFAAVSGPAFAQQYPQVAQPVVQAVPQKSAGMRLNDALGQLARSPQDVAALADAGQASLDLGDAQAAIGFFRRALTLQPANVRIKTGLAGAYVLSEDPFTAIELFDEAEKDGPIDPARLADRGLAFDMVGDNQTAQYFYRQSLAKAPSDETLRRLALSQAISRDRKGMDQTLAPLLQKQDKAAWRTRAFGLAILGQPDEAEAIARQTMPADMAGAITAYLRYMTKLTAAQQAAAGNLGRFPRASEIGSDDPRVAYFSRSRVKVAAAQPVAATPVKGKKPKDDKKAREKARQDEAKAAATLAAAPPPPNPVISRETTSVTPKLAAAELPPVKVTPAPAPVPAPVSRPPVTVTRVAATTPAPTRVPTPTPVTIVAPTPTPTPAPTPSPALTPAPAPAPTIAAVTRPAATVPQPGFGTLESEGAAKVSGFDLARASTPAPAPAPKPAARPSAQPKPPTIDEAFADLAPPSREVEPEAGAVDVRVIRGKSAPAKDAVAAKDPKAKDAKDSKSKDVKDPKAKDGKDAKDAKAKAAMPSYPSRIWVQLATGRDKSALGFDWRKMVKEDPAVFKGKTPSTTAWGQANRLLAGPFPSAKEANAFLAQVKKAGIAGAFVWTSPAGQIVDALGAK